MTLSWGFDIDDARATAAAGRLSGALGQVSGAFAASDVTAQALERRLRSMSTVELEAASASRRLADANAALTESVKAGSGERAAAGQLAAARAVRSAEAEFRRAAQAARSAAVSEEELGARARAAAGGLASLSDRELEVATAAAKLRDASSKLQESLRSAGGAADKLTTDQLELEGAVRRSRAALAAAQHGLDDYTRAEQRAAHQSRLSSQSLEALGMAAKSGGAALAALGVAAGIAGVAGVGVLAVALGRLISEGAKAEIWAQRYRASLGIVMKSSQAGAEWFDTVRRQAADLGLGVDMAVEEFQRLNNVGFAPKDAARISAMTADLQALGVRAESIGSILNAMGKIKAQGVLQGDELMMLAEAGINVGLIYERIADRAGVAVDKVKKLQASGEIKAEWALPSIEEAVLEATGVQKAGDAARKVADTTIQGMIGRGRAGFRNWLIDLGYEIAPGLQTIADRVGGTIARLSENGTLKRFSDSIIGVFDTSVRWVDAHWPQIESIVEGTLRGVAEAFDTTSDAVTWVQDNWSSIEPVLIGVAGAVGVVTAAVALAGATLVAGAWVATAAIGGIVAGVAWVVASVDDAVDGIWNRLRDAAIGMVQLGRDIVDGLVLGIRNAIGNVVEAVTDVANIVRDTYRRVMDSHSPSRVMFAAGFDTGMGAVAGIEAANDNARRASERLGYSVRGGFVGGLGGPQGGGHAPQLPGPAAPGPAIAIPDSGRAPAMVGGGLNVTFGPGSVVIQGTGAGGSVSQGDVEAAITAALQRVAAQLGFAA